MKTHSLKSLFTHLALALVLTGCVSKSYDKGSATATALQTSADAAAQTSTRVTDVLGALNTLTFKAQGDLRTQYDAFVGATTGLNSAMETLNGSVAELHAKADVYFENWTNQTALIQNESLRQNSAVRKADVSGKLEEVLADYARFKTAFKPFNSDLADIRTYLGTDLTTGGLATIKEVVQKTKVDALPLRDAIKDLQASFSSLSTAISPVLPTAKTP